MSNRNKAKGTAAESNVRQYLRARGWTHARRLTLGGAKDPGDITLGDGIPITVEVKDCARIELAAWLDEANREMSHNGHAVSAVWFKRRGKGSPADWYVLMDGSSLTSLLAAAGYGPEARPVAP